MGSFAGRSEAWEGRESPVSKGASRSEAWGGHERERALRVRVRLGREVRVRVRVIRGLRERVRLGRVRKRACKRNIAPLIIEKKNLL